MILVTGATSNIGQELVQQLLSAGYSLKLISSSHDDLSQWDIYSDKIQFFQTNILDVTEVYEIVKDVEAVFHCDTIDDFQAVSYESRMKYNVEGTANIVNAMIYHGVKRLIFFSTLKAKLTVPNKISDENTKAEINEWTTEYALSMILAEREVWRGNVEGLDINIINSAEILSKNNSENHLYAEAIQTIKNGKVEIYPSQLHYIGVKDLVQLSIKILQGNHWNASWLAIGGSLGRKSFYSLIAQIQSLRMKTRVPTSITLKIVKDILIKIFSGKERSFRKANGRFLMTNFQFDHKLTTDTFDMKWNSLENWLSQNSTNNKVVS